MTSPSLIIVNDQSPLGESKKHIRQYPTITFSLSLWKIKAEFSRIRIEVKWFLRHSEVDDAVTWFRRKSIPFE
jgi:hypothetical protein